MFNKLGTWNMLPLYVCCHEMIVFSRVILTESQPKVITMQTK